MSTSQNLMQLVQCGIASLDKHHEWLVLLLEKLHLLVKTSHATKTPITKEKLDTIIIAIQKFADLHFAAELKLMLASQYPQIKEHNSTHTLFMVRISEIIEASNNEQIIPVEMIEELTAFIEKWIYQHELEDDKKLTDYLIERHQKYGFDPEVLLRR